MTYKFCCHTSESITCKVSNVSMLVFAEGLKYRIVPSKHPYPCTRPPPNFDGFVVLQCNRPTEWTCIIGSSVIHRGQPDSGESCVVLQSGLTRSLVVKFPQRSVVVACSTRISCCGPTFGFTTQEFSMVPMAANFTFGVGPCMGIVEPFKRVLRVTAHPQILALELGVPMGTCSGQYCSYSYRELCIHCVTFATFLQPLPTYMLLGI